MTTGLAAGVHARLLARAKERHEDFNLLLARYAVERFLYRLSVSDARDRYWLKGALLFDLWFGVPHRPTRDADFLGFGPVDAALLADTIAAICQIEAEDGMAYDPGSIVVEEIREDARYGGLRVTLVGFLGKARCTVQLDVGYGDAVTPGPEEITLPTLLEDQPPPHLRAYPRATVVSEKLEAIVTLGMANSRMKDYFDLRALALEGRLDPGLLADAIAATFARRQTAVPRELPVGLSDEFAKDASKLAQWRGFLARNRLEPIALSDVIGDVCRFLEEPLRLVRERGAAQ